MRKYRFSPNWVRSCDSNLPQVIPRTRPLFSYTQNVLETVLSSTPPYLESEKRLGEVISMDKRLIRSMERFPGAYRYYRKRYPRDNAKKKKKKKKER